MSFLATRPNPFLTAIASISGAGSLVFPLSAPWQLIFLFAAALSYVFLQRSTILSITIASILGGSVLAGFLPSPIGTALLAATALFGSPMQFIGPAILAMNTSLISTIVQLIGQALFPLGLEIVAPTFVAIIIIWMLGWRYWFQSIAATFCTVLLALIARHFQISPFLQMACVSFPALALIGGLQIRPVARVSFIPILTLVLALIISWMVTPPRSASQTFLLLPNSESAPESKYFSNYENALRFSGIIAQRTTDPHEIPTEAFVLMPWLTTSFSNDSDDRLMQSIGNLARERRWTVILAGEHNDLGKSSQRILALTDKFQTRNDLTVPPGNTDDSGPLQVLSLGNWLHEAAFNRGASVPVSSLWDKVLLAGDGWWAERDIGEWLWVGDYIWQPGDRAGRLSLSVAFDDRGARWIIIGDNTPFINSQLYADPRPVLQLMQSSTLWPALQKDALLCALILLFLLPSTAMAASKLRAVMLTLVVLFPLASFASSREHKSRGWEDTYIRQSGFDQRNFNEIFSSNPSLFEGRRIIRKATSISGSLNLPAGNIIAFARVEGAAHLSGVTLHNCRRLGSLQTAEGPLLMDAQACEVDGAAQILIGTPQSAAALSVTNGAESVILILDTAFLAQNSPEANVKWLMSQIESRTNQK